MSWGIEWRRRAVATAFVMALGGCGGGQQVDPFEPTRIVSFGDETSVLEDSGDHNALKYAVNYETAASGATPASIDCTQFPIWIQTLASTFGLVFAECNYGDTPGEPSAFIHAEVGAHAADVHDQVQDFLSAGESFGEKDLVTILAGAHDVLDEYQRVRDGLATEAQAKASLKATGAALAAEVNSVANAGAKVIVSTIPDMGITPYAVTEEAAGVTDAAKLLSELSAAFNTELRVRLIDDGHKIGLVVLDESLKAASKTGNVNVVDPACEAAIELPNCTTLTLSSAVTEPWVDPPTIDTVGSWMWADATRLGVYGQKALGSIASARATGNPF
jgi:outer membrane lipase/esterase